MTEPAAAAWLAERGKEMERDSPRRESKFVHRQHEGGRKVASMLAATFAIEGLAKKEIASARYADHLVFDRAATSRKNRSRSSVTSIRFFRRACSKDFVAMEISRAVPACST